MTHLDKYENELQVGNRVIYGYGGKYYGRFNLAECAIEELSDKSLVLKSDRMLAFRHAIKHTPTEVVWPVIRI